MSALQRLRA